MSFEDIDPLLLLYKTKPVGNFALDIDFAANNINIRSILDTKGFDDEVPSIINLFVHSNVRISSIDPEVAALTSGTIQSIHEVTLIIKGEVAGFGEGDAISVSTDCSITINRGGKVLSTGGFAIRKNGYVVNVVNNGTTQGAIG